MMGAGQVIGRRIVDVFDLLVNDRGEVLLALPDLGIEVPADARPRYVFEGMSLVLRHADGRVLVCPEIDEETKAKVAAAAEMVVTEGEGRNLLRAYEALNGAAAAAPRR